MATEKQIRANRENAKHSTGPRTAVGKSTSGLNAVKHGVLAQHVVLPGEDAEEFQMLQEGLRESLQPRGAEEELLLDIMVMSAWRLQRCVRVETARFNEAIYGEVAAKARTEILCAVDDSPQWQQSVKMAIEEESEAISKAPGAHRRLKEAEAILCGADAKIAHALVTDEKETLLTRLPRYEAHFQRSFLRALAELRNAQAKRAQAEQLHLRKR